MKWLFEKTFLLSGLLLLSALFGCTASRLPTAPAFQDSVNFQQQLIVDDLEDGNTFINTQLIGSSGGAWSTLTWGDPSNVVNSPFVVPGGPAGSANAVHIFGTLKDNGNGQYPAFALQCRLNTGSTYDASLFQGIRFDYKIGADNVQTRRFFITLPELTPLSDGGTCTGTSGRCGDSFGAFLDPAPTNWTKMVFNFSSLVQEGWGLKPDPPDLPGNADHLFWLQWNHSGGNVAGTYNVDYWVDNVEFF